jgi:hypothetical protein
MPRARAAEKIVTRLNAVYSDQLKAAVKDKFQIDIRIDYNLSAAALTSSRTDGKAFTAAQKEWMAAFEEGYIAAMDAVLE